MVPKAFRQDVVMTVVYKLRYQCLPVNIVKTLLSGVGDSVTVVSMVMM